MAALPQERTLGFARVTSAADDGLPVRELLNILRRRKRVIFGAVVLLTGMTTFYGLQNVPTYTATASIMIEPQKMSVVNIKEVLPGLSTEWGTLDTQVLETQADLVRSRDVIVQTMEALDLFNDPEFGAVAPEGDTPGGTVPGGLLHTGAEWLRAQLYAWKQVTAEWLRRLRLITIGPTETGEADTSVDTISPEEAALSAEELARETAIATFADNLHVARSGNASVLSISYTSQDPVKAAGIANRLSSVYTESQLHDRRKATDRANAWLSNRLQALQDELLEAERAVARFQAENQLVAAKGTALSEAQLTDLNRVLIEARAKKAEVEARLRLIRELETSGEGLDSLAEAVASPLIAGLRQQEAQLLRQEAELRTTYGERHPQIQALREEKANLAARITDEVNRIVRSLNNELTVLTARERNLEQELQAVKSETAIEGQAAVQARELEREAAARRTLYETFLKRYQETKTQEELLESEVRVIFPAAVPSAPSSPSPKIFAAIGFTASAVFGCMLALLLEQLDRSLRSSRQIERILEVPCLGLVPRIRELRRDEVPADYLCNKPRSAYAVATRAMYTATVGIEIDPASKVILVTSALPSEGKTSVASSLAVLAASLGKQTLLVDLDLWHPSVARKFGFRPAAGIAEVIAGDVPLEEALVPDHATGIDILPVRRRPGDTMAILTSQRMGWLLSELRGRYDCVVVDSPPLLGLPDAQVLSAYADAVILVVRWERTKQDAAIAALQALRDASANVAGAVLNQVDLKKHARYRYGDAAQFYDSYRKYYQD